MGVARAAQVMAALHGRDRVLDAVKTVALLLVVLGHSLAWHVPASGEPVNVLEVAPGLTVLTWVFQVLPLFFAAGAVANAASVARHSRADYLAGRTRRLGTPVLTYAGIWSALLLPLALWLPAATQVGVFVAQLLWFAGTYLAVAAAAPWTRRWTARPGVVFPLWGAAVVVVDWLRVAGAPAVVGWVNLLLVWGLLHQLGYHLPALRRRPRGWLLAGAAGALGAAIALAGLGPYSWSLVTVGADQELSNLAPPSVVLALYGVAQVLVLAAAWPALERLLARDRVWAVVAVAGARSMGIYLWHIPLVALAAGLALLANWRVPPLGAAWWAVHVAVALLVVPGAWFVAGIAQHAERRVGALPRLVPLPLAVAAFAAAVLVLDLSVTGCGTWAGPGMLGLPSSTLPLLGLLWLCWQAAGAPRRAAAPVSVT